MLTAYFYYEEQLDGLGERFLAEVYQRLNDLEKHPDYYSYVDERKILRDVSEKGFPYAVVYKLVEREVNVLAVLHTKRDNTGVYH